AHVQLVTAASSHDVTDVIVAGRFIVRDGRLSAGDLAPALEKLRAAAKSSFDPASPAKADAEMLLPYVLEQYDAICEAGA
ncbi:MAG: hypothetical protein JJ899_14200, partial [Alphaproteobacteria bacterium]|nr:hypothetical protein [Alphaproteobacteria bacterium]